MSDLTTRTPLTTQVAQDDFIHVVDKSDTTDSPEGTSKKVDIKYVIPIKVLPGFGGYIIIPGNVTYDGTIVQENDILIGKGAFFSGEYVMMRATQDNPTLDAHFKRGLRGEEEA